MAVCPKEGCGHVNDDDKLGACTKCDSILITSARSDGRCFKLGDNVCFFCKMSKIFQLGNIIHIDGLEGPNGATVRVKYADKAWRDDRYDQKLAPDELFTSMDEASSTVKRERKKTSQYVPALEPPKIKKVKSLLSSTDGSVGMFSHSGNGSIAKNGHFPTILKGNVLQVGGKRKLKTMDAAENETANLDDKDDEIWSEQAYVGEVLLTTAKAKAISESKSSAEVNAHSEAQKQSGESSGLTKKKFYKKGVLLRDRHSNNSNGSNGHQDALLKRKDTRYGHETTNDSEWGLTASEALIIMRDTPWHDVDLSQVLYLFDVTSNTTIEENSNCRNTVLANHGRRLDKYLLRGLLCALYNWAKPPLTDAQRDLCGADWLPSRLSLSCEALVSLALECPLTTEELAASSTPALQKLLLTPPPRPLPWFDEDDTMTLQGTSSSPSLVTVAPPRGTVPGESGEGSAGSAVIEVINAYLRRRGRHPASTSALPTRSLHENAACVADTHCFAPRDKEAEQQQGDAACIIADILYATPTNAEPEQQRFTAVCTDDTQYIIATNIEVERQGDITSNVDAHYIPPIDSEVEQQQVNTLSVANAQFTHPTDRVVEQQQADTAYRAYAAENHYTPPKETESEQLRRMAEVVSSSIGSEKTAEIYGRVKDRGTIHLPLSYEEYTFMQEAAFDLLGGRDAVEKDPRIKGAKVEKGTDMMYGGMYEGFTEELVQRTCIGAGQSFVDIGSGIGQICLQVAATVPCAVAGIELDRDSFMGDRDWPGLSKEDAAQAARNSVKEMNALIAGADVLFFNNFGPWFMKPAGKDKVVPMNHFCEEQMKISRIGKQVLTLNSLIELSHWLHTRTFTLGGGDDKSSDRQCTWTSEPVNVFHYTILSYKWKCVHCTNINHLSSTECEVCMRTCRSLRSGLTSFKNR